MVCRAAGTVRWLLGLLEGILERLVVVEPAARSLRPLAGGVERAGVTALRRRLLAWFARLGPHPPAGLAASRLGRARGPGPPRPLGHRAVEFAAEIAGGGTAGAGPRGCGPLGRPALAAGASGGRCGCRCCPRVGLCARRTPAWRALGRAAPRRGVRCRIPVDGPIPASRRRGGFAENQPGKFRCDRCHNSRGGRGLALLGRSGVGGFVCVSSALRCQTDIPPAQPDQQDRRREEQHQREAFDERISAVDRQVLHAAELASVEQEIRPGHGDEKDERGLDHGGEQPCLLNRQNSQKATEGIADGEHRAELAIARTCIESKADRGCGDRQQHSSPPRHTGESRVYRAMVSRHCRLRALS